MKDHEKASLVNLVVTTATTYAGMQQLRERIKGVLLPVLDAPSGIGWKRYPETRPNVVVDDAVYAVSAWPVAYIHDEIGLIVELAEYHPGYPIPWILVGDGYPVEPYAWFDLPEPPPRYI